MTEQTQTTKRCKYCGREISSETPFCWYCGRELETRPERPMEPEGKGLPAWVYIAGAVALAILLALMAANLL